MENIEKTTKKETLLDVFVLKKFQEYIEPQRKGTPKGETIGLKKHKYFAALLCLKDNASIIELARILKVEPGLLSKWRTEPGFREVTQGLAIEFTEILFRHLKKRAERSFNLIQEYLAMPFKEMTLNLVPVLSWREFKDLRLYGDLLISLISKRSMREMDGWLKMNRNEKEFYEKSILIRQYDDLMRIMANIHSEYRDKISNKPKEIITEEEVLKVRDALEKDDLNERDRKTVIARFYILSNKTREIDMDLENEES